MTLAKVSGSAVRLRAVLLTALAAASVAAPASADGAIPSTNWAGYVASPSAAVGSRFGSVSGSWRVPTATCAPGRESYSAVWVGLGGANEKARALEQIGTDADCARSGQAAYAGWFELIPAGPVALGLRLHPGDEMAASVTVRSRDVTLRIRDLSTGARFATTKRVSTVDVSSAEWIVEAPSVCVTANACGTLALANFGKVAFSNATATADKHTGTIEDPDWSATAVELHQGAGHGFGRGPGPRFGPTGALIVATPSSPPGAGGSFAVSWQEQPIEIEAPSAPTLPGFSGGPP